MLFKVTEILRHFFWKSHQPRTIGLISPIKTPLCDQTFVASRNSPQSGSWGNVAVISAGDVSRVAVLGPGPCGSPVSAGLRPCGWQRRWPRRHLGSAGHGPPAGSGLGCLSAGGDLGWNVFWGFGETFWFAAAITVTLDKIIAMERRDLHWSVAENDREDLCAV